MIPPMGYSITRRSYTLGTAQAFNLAAAVSTEWGNFRKALPQEKRKSGGDFLGLDFDPPNLWPR